MGLFHVDFAVSRQTIVKAKTTKPWSVIKCFLNTKTKKIGISENMPQYGFNNFSLGMGENF